MTLFDSVHSLIATRRAAVSLMLAVGSLAVFSAGFAGGARANSIDLLAPQASIINGTTVPNDPAQWPFIVALVDQYGYQFCGGSLIKPHWVVTAAHCTDPRWVLIGRKSLSGTGGEILPVAQTFTNPLYNTTTHENDIQLLRLGTDSSYASSAIPLISASEDPPNGASVGIAGWGATDPAGTIYPDNLQQATVQVVDNTSCDADYGGGAIFPSMLCAVHFSPAPAMDTCFGDSGGPLVYMTAGGLKLAGLTSWGTDPCAMAPYPGVYTRVSLFRSWISLITGRYLAGPATATSLGSQKLGVKSGALAVTLTSSGDDPVTVSRMSTSNSEFTVESENCTTAGAIPNGGACTVNVSFKPSGLGTRTGTLVVKSDSEGGTDTNVSLSGVGLTDPNSKGTIPVSLALAQAGRSKPSGAKLTAVLRVSYAIPLGATAGTACVGGVKALIKVSGVRSAVHVGSPVMWQGTRCQSVLRMHLPRKARHKRATVTVSFSGNTALAPTSKKFKTRIR